MDAETDGTLQRSDTALHRAKTKLERRLSRSESAMSDVSEDGTRKVPRTQGDCKWTGSRLSQWCCVRPSC